VRLIHFQNTHITMRILPIPMPGVYSEQTGRGDCTAIRFLVSASTASRRILATSFFVNRFLINHSAGFGSEASLTPNC
jgi:hypothetical protein